MFDFNYGVLTMTFNFKRTFTDAAAVLGISGGLFIFTIGGCQMMEKTRQDGEEAFAAKIEQKLTPAFHEAQAAHKMSDAKDKVLGGITIGLLTYGLMGSRRRQKFDAIVKG
jgi:hypothetical protein